MKNIGLNVKLGITSGLLICLIWFFAAKMLGYYSLLIYSYKFYSTILFLLLGVFIVTLYQRKQNGSFIDFKEAVKTALLYSIVLASVITLFNTLYHAFIATDAIDYFVSQEKQAWIAHGRTDAETAEYITKFYIPSFGSFHTFMTTIIWGVLFSLLAGAVTRKKRV